MSDKKIVMPGQLSVDMSQKIARQLADMDNGYADILSMKYVYGFSDKDIAGLCNINERKVRATLAGAKKAIIGIMAGDMNER